MDRALDFAEDVLTLDKISEVGRRGEALERLIDVFGLSLRVRDFSATSTFRGQNDRDRLPVEALIRGGEQPFGILVEISETVDDLRRDLNRPASSRRSSQV